MERGKFPVATEVFAHREDKRVLQQACELHREYLKDPIRTRLADQLLHFDDGDVLTPRDEDERRINALTQLESCIETGRDPIHPILN